MGDSKSKITPCHVGRIKFISEQPEDEFQRGKARPNYPCCFLENLLFWVAEIEETTHLQFSFAVIFKILAAFEQNQYSILSCLQSLLSSRFIMSSHEWWVCTLKYIMYTILYDHTIIFHGPVMPCMYVWHGSNCPIGMPKICKDSLL